MPLNYREWDENEARLEREEDEHERWLRDMPAITESTMKISSGEFFDAVNAAGLIPIPCSTGLCEIRGGKRVVMCLLTAHDEFAFWSPPQTGTVADAIALAQATPPGTENEGES